MAKGSNPLSFIAKFHGPNVNERSRVFSSGLQFVGAAMLFEK